jgi:3-hydroxyisobutyrate dehydrogenase-like beta-hydroxyacid dehydrogenase
MTRHFIVALAVALSVGFGPAQLTNAQSHPSQGMPGMMSMHEQMMADMKAADARLDQLIKDMNAANGNAKVTAMAAVVSELVAQHKSIHEQMGQMHQQMMGGRGMMNR